MRSCGLISIEFVIKVNNKKQKKISDRKICHIEKRKHFAAAVRNLK